MSPTDHLRRRARLLLTLLAYTHTRFPPDRTSALAAALRAWLGTWSGVGRVVEGMMRLGYDVQLTRYGAQGWRATFYASGITIRWTAAVGSAVAPTPWHAVQAAALLALMRADEAH